MEEQLRSKCETCRLGSIPEGLDLMVTQHHNQLHPPGNPGPGVTDIEYCLDNIVPDGEDGLLILWAEHSKLGWQNHYTSQLFVYLLREGKLSSPSENRDEAIALFRAAEAKTPSEVRLVCTLAAGAGGGDTVNLDVAATRCGGKMNFDTALGDEPPAAWLIRHHNKVDSAVLTDSERAWLIKELTSLVEDLVMQIEIYPMVAVLMEHQREAEAKSDKGGDGPAES
eukprot:TRINITY_DN106684_c0_g1_i1.p1 TRINITY_DN106684_c0_g1~~TRINITY_DN106684_c0_g1_i1.p1  ORF type:complete len:225 (-),score=40.72 TRINITY_DN106684_c0_g1_i1:272-946(-)